MEEIQSDDTGSVRFGNFINYYSFNPVENRMRLFPDYSKYINQDRRNVICLDVGCNVGELTQALQKHLENVLRKGRNKEEDIRNTHILAVDLDDHLITRAKSANKNQQIKFVSVDVLSDSFKQVCDNFFQKHDRHIFDVVYCFSITMWIHLNHGDAGLRQFLVRLSELADLLVVEPQPWKCYNRAVRRMKRANANPFEHFSNIKIRSNIESYIDSVLVKECNFENVLQLAPTVWGRQVSFYKRNK